MKALILNSGTGTRMGGLTSNTCKCLVEVSEGVTIFDLQMKFLLEAGITEFCITTGYHAEKLQNYAKERFPGVKFIFVHNPLFDTTNYIYSIHLAKDFLQGDVLLLHGDLLFERSVLYDILASPNSAIVTDKTQPLPPKDFKAVVSSSGKIEKVGVNEFGDGACYTQPLYKLQKPDWLVWLAEINRFCEEGITKVYAENALNEISGKINLHSMEIDGRLCFEVDNSEDLSFGREVYIKLEKQQIYEGFGSFSKMEEIVAVAKKVFIVCDPWLKGTAEMLDCNKVLFSDYTPNPKHEEIEAGIALFDDCDFIVSLGGGSAIDVAKCINKSFCEHLAIPTTAGTGSESTRFAVIYKDGEKISVEHDELLPSHVILDPAFLSTLPDYQKKSTLLDALCQAIESIWAKGATNESKAYAKRAIPLIMDNVDLYLDGNTEAAKAILTAANLAGKAINISKTTAPHAMSYKMSTMFDIAHGHAVGLCMLGVWADLIERCTDQQNVKNSLDEIAAAMGEATHMKALYCFSSFVERLQFAYAISASESAIQELATSVNLQRLSNHPVFLSEQNLVKIYRTIG